MLDVCTIQGRLKQDQSLKAVVEEAAGIADRYIKEGRLPPLSYSIFRLFERSGDRDRYQKVYFERRGIVNALVTAYLATDQESYLLALQDALWEICEEFTWCLPAHLPRGQSVIRPDTVDLFAAETAHMLAEVVTLLGDRLEPEIHQQVKQQVTKRVFTPVFDSPIKHFWETAHHNWASVCAGSVGMAVMLLEKDREKARPRLDRMKEVMEAFLSGYGADGGCAEGIGYWEYGFGFYVYFADMLLAYSGGQEDLLQSDKIRAIAAFPAAVYLSEGIYVNYSDSQEFNRIHPGLMSYLYRRFGTGGGLLEGDGARIPGMEEDPCRRWAPMIRNLAWTTGIYGETTQAAERSQPMGQFQQGLSCLPDLGWYVDRRRAGDNGKLLAFSAKGGHNSEPHNHNDLGHFILHAGGTSLLCDLGSGQYTKDYFGEKRYSILYNSSLGHSVPVFDGYTQEAGREYKAEVLEAVETVSGSKLSLDLTEAYPVEAGLGRVVRTFVWKQVEGSGGCLLELVDQVQYRTVVESRRIWEERFVSRIKPEIELGSVSWQCPEARLTLRYDNTFLLDMDTVQLTNHSGLLEQVFILKLKRSVEGALQEVQESFQFRLEALNK